MDEDKKKIKQNENLRKARSLNTLAHSPEYTETLLPYLQKLAQVPFIDSTFFKTDEEFLHALKNANARAGAFMELITFLSQQEAIIKRINEELEKPTKAHGI